MVICKYYLKGTCRYGNQCKFDHVSQDSGDNSLYQSRGGYNSTDRGSYSKGNYQGRNDGQSYRYVSPDYQNRRGGRADTDWQQDRQSNWSRNEAHQYQRAQYDDSSRQRHSYDQNNARQRTHYDDTSHRQGTQYDDTYQNQRSQANEFREGRRYPNQAERHSNFNSRQQAHTGAAATVDPVEEVLSLISEEMALWENCQMWPFSCFAFTREACSIPGLDDFSMDEVRLHAYECMAAGKSADYLAWMRSMKTEYAGKRQQLVNPSDSMRSSLIRLIKEELDLEKAGNGGGTAAGQRYSSASTILVNPADGIGWNNSAALSSNAVSSSFGHFMPTPNAFEASGQMSFGNAASGTQFFSNNTQMASTVRSNASEAQPFGNVGPGFSTTTAAFGFGESRPMATTQPPTSSFVTSQSIAATQSTQATSSRSIFGQPTGVHGATAASVSGSASSQIYTPVEQLSGEERLQFESAKFTLGNVPVKPPPQLYV